MNPHQFCLIGEQLYYVIFVDQYTKYMWIYKVKKTEFRNTYFTQCTFSPNPGSIQTS